MDKCLTRFDQMITGIALWGGGATLLGLIGLTVFDVILRYFFNAPLHGARDIAQILLLTTVALATPYSARTGGQIAIEIFSTFLEARQLRLVDITIRLLGAAMLIILAWRLLVGGHNASRFGEASLTLNIPFAPCYYLLACGMLLYALVLGVETALLLAGQSITSPADHQDSQ